MERAVMKRLLVLFAIALCASAQTVVLLTTPGASTWTAPNGVVSIKVECVGGGGGASTMTTNGAGGGGGGGAYAGRMTMAVTPGTIYSYTVGAAGLTNGGGNGGASTFTGDSGVQCIAAGGISVANNQLLHGAGGLVASSTGDVSHVFAGGLGADGSSGSYGGGGGGASGGSAATGTAAANGAGATAVTGGGPGGAGKASPQGAGNAPASGPGGGGGGGLRTSSGTRSGGNGFSGQIKITFNMMTTSVSESTRPMFTESGTGQYTANNIKTASFVENIQYVSADQNRWTFGISQVNAGSDRGGQGLRAAVTESLIPLKEITLGVKPAQSFARVVAETIPYVSSEQNRWGLALNPTMPLSEVAQGLLSGFQHFTAVVLENVPYVEAGHFDWSAGTTIDNNLPSQATSQSFVAGGGGVTTVPRRSIVIQ